MIIKRDLQVRMDDGIKQRADVYRPDTTSPVPVIMTHGPYGKGVASLGMASRGASPSSELIFLGRFFGRSAEI